MMMENTSALLSASNTRSGKNQTKRTKSVKSITSIFLVIGSFALLIGINSVWDTLTFMKKSEKTVGVITDITARASRNSNGSMTTYYYPVYRFADKTGKVYELHSSTGSGRPPYTIGQDIDIFYSPDMPEEAKINTFSELWLFATIICSFGIIFTFVGGMMRYLLLYKDKIDKDKAINYTAIVDAKVTEVLYDTSIVVNGRSPFRIIAQWYDTRVNKIYVFKSQKFWFNPSEFLSETIEVNADPTNYKKYWMDTSFIPELVE